MGRINLVLDASMLDTLQSCEAKFYYRYRLNKVTEIKSKPLDRGGLIHVGMEAYWNALKESKPWATAVDEMLMATRLAISTESDLDSTDTDRVLEVLEENVHFWRINDLSYQINTVEKPFLYELYKDEHVKFLLMGKIDLIVSDGKYTNLPIDHKSYERDFPLRNSVNQFTNYAIATDSNYLLVNRIGFQKSLKPHEKHKRVPLSYNPDIKHQWKNNTIKWFWRYFDCLSENDWPENRTSCDKYNRLCEYHEITSTSGEESKIYKLNTMFKTDKPWDVTRILSKKGE